MITIERIANGWTVTEGMRTEAFLDLHSLFDHLLLMIDGRSELFGGDSYGKVILKLKEPTK